MRRLLKWALRILGGLATLILLAAVAVYALSARKLASRDLPEVTALPPADSAMAARGPRLVRVLGCTGCHGSDLGGSVMVESPVFGRLVAPNLTQTRERFSDDDFVRVLRHGLRPDGTPLTPAMPSQAFTHLSDRDLAAILAYVRSQPAVPDSLPSTRLALPLRAMLVAGVLELSPDLIEAGERPETRPGVDDPEALGRYLASATCVECHGADLRGNERFIVTPDLAIVAGYTPERLREFFRTGIAIGGRELPTMSRIARGRYAGFTDGEVEALYAYLSRLGEPGD